MKHGKLATFQTKTTLPQHTAKELTVLATSAAMYKYITMKSLQKWNKINDKYTIVESNVGVQITEHQKTWTALAIKLRREETNLSSCVAFLRREVL